VLDADDLTHTYAFRLFPDGTGDGVGPSGTRHTRFRTWKEDLNAHQDPAAARHPD